MITKMVTILSFLFTNANVVISENVTYSTFEPVSPEPRNAFKFEDQPDTPQSYGLIRFEGQSYQPQHSQPEVNHESQGIKFEEENRIENQKLQKKKRRRRRPRQKLPNGPGFQNGEIPGHPVRSGPAFPEQFYAGTWPYPQSGYPGQFYKPRPSSTGALTAVTEALASIAQYDDRQCVARLLCEAAGGTGGGKGGGAVDAGTAGGGLLQAIGGLQPLLALLAAYNGITSSPLFVFGRAVFLGMTSRANPGTCRYAYPDCPTDPEQLVHYLNNHNGGFFRFFAAPELSQQQNLEQFYHQLSGQNYGYYQPQQNLPNAQLQNPYQFEGLNLQPYPNQHQGFYQNQYLQPNSYDLSQQPNYQYLQNIGHQRPSLYGKRYGLYGHKYPYQQNFNNYKFKNAKIEKRIQNTRNTDFIYNDAFANTKWKFPGDSSFTNKNVVNNVRLGKVLKFPKDNVDPVKSAQGFVFPGSQSNRDYTANNIDAIDSDFGSGGSTSVNDLRFENQYHYGIEADDDINMEGVRILYVVRGNGDPSEPEVVRLEPGQTL